jgi:hypothetical protein
VSRAEVYDYRDDRHAGYFPSRDVIVIREY